MIHANELRIGHIVWDDSGYVIVDAELILELQHKVAKVDPISLTPEILEKAGFKQSNEFDDTFRLGEFDVYYRKSYCEWTVDDRGDNEGSKRRFVKYLHQLQNIYFFIANKELEINL